MKRSFFAVLCVVCLFVASLACTSGSSSVITSSAPPASGTLSGSQSSAPPGSTAPPAALFLSWSEPTKSFIVTAGQDTYVNVRGDATVDPTATISVGYDSDTDYDNEGITWFSRTYKGGPFLVTVSAMDFAPGTYYFVAKIVRGSQTIVHYLANPVIFRDEPNVWLSYPDVDTVATRGQDFTFSGYDSASGSTIRIGLDTDRNPSNGGITWLTIPNIPTGQFSKTWTVLASLTGRFYPVIQAKSVTIEEYSYSDGSILVGDIASIRFTSPMNSLDVHPRPTVSLTIAGTSTSTTPGAVMSIGYDTDTDATNGGIVWVVNNVPVGNFSVLWNVDITVGGTYYVVGEITDAHGTVDAYAPGAITVDNSNYIEFYTPISDVTITAGEFFPIPVTGYAYSAALNGTVNLFYDTDTNVANGTTAICASFAEGSIDVLFDISELPAGEYYIGATLVRGFSTLVTAWAPMKLTVMPNADLSNPANSGPFFSAASTITMTDPARADKNVTWTVHYPADTLGSAVVSTQAPFPVVLFFPDSYVADTSYSYLVDRITRWGYVVITVNTSGNFAYSTDDSSRMDALDGTFIINWMQTVVLDNTSPYYNAMDMLAIASSGHGRGGGSSIMIARDDTRIKAVVAISTRRPMTTAPSSPYIANVPIMIYSGSKSNVNNYKPANQQSVYNDQKAYKQLTTIVGGNHVQFKDTVAQWDFDGTPTLSLLEQHRRTQVMTVSFLNAFLKNQPYYMAWVNGDQVPGLGNVTIQYLAP
ncbi:MAG: hypothetical protein WC712_04295 [Candidatus Brocadiia bacterium]